MHVGAQWWNFEDNIDGGFVQLNDYTKFHFESEENFYRESHLPDYLLAEYKMSHTALVAEVQQLKWKYNSYTDKERIFDDMLSMLIFWLANHILNDDMRMVTIISLLEKGVKIEGVENLVTRELEETKSSISKIILAMTEVSNANYKELRREVNYRREVEKELKYEIVVRKEAEEKLKNLAFYDPLTGLANRRLFEELCSAALRAAEREKLMQAILFIDIDGFKSINFPL